MPKLFESAKKGKSEIKNRFIHSATYEGMAKEDGQITDFFQLAHAGRQTTKKVAGEFPIGPSAKGRDPLNFVKPKEMGEQDIQSTIEAFGSAAKRAVKTGVDGIQIHAAHGYLVDQFLSPFFTAEMINGVVVTKIDSAF